MARFLVDLQEIHTVRVLIEADSKEEAQAGNFEEIESLGTDDISFIGICHFHKEVKE